MMRPKLICSLFLIVFLIQGYSQEKGDIEISSGIRFAASACKIKWNYSGKIEHISVHRNLSVNVVDFPFAASYYLNKDLKIGRLRVKANQLWLRFPNSS